MQHYCLFMLKLLLLYVRHLHLKHCVKLTENSAKTKVQDPLFFFVLRC